MAIILSIGSRTRFVFGLTGPIAGGKGKVAEMLQGEPLFPVYYSLSDRVREVAARRGIENPTREILQDIGDGLRRDFGGGIIAQLTAGLAFQKSAAIYVIDSIRNPAEVEFFRNISDFALIAITASQKTRFERLLKRNRPSDPKAWEEFLARDNRDLGIGQEASGQQVGKCIEMADYQLDNERTAEELSWKLADVVVDISLRFLDDRLVGLLQDFAVQHGRKAR